jgi:hypothetical protein
MTRISRIFRAKQTYTYFSTRTTFTSHLPNPLVLRWLAGGSLLLALPANPRKGQQMSSLVLMTLGLWPKNCERLQPKVCAAFVHLCFFATLLPGINFLENVAPARRSDRATKGQGGALERLQASSEAIQPGQGVKKPKKTRVQGIPEDIVANPIAPVPKTRTRRKVDVNFMPLITSSIDIFIVAQRSCFTRGPASSNGPHTGIVHCGAGYQTQFERY